MEGGCCLQAQSLYVWSYSLLRPPVRQRQILSYDRDVSGGSVLHGVFLIAVIIVVALPCQFTPSHCRWAPASAGRYDVLSCGLASPRGTGRYTCFPGSRYWLVEYGRSFVSYAPYERAPLCFSQGVLLWTTCWIADFGSRLRCAVISWW